MSIDYTPQIEQNIKELSELAKSSIDMSNEFQKDVIEQGVQVGDYLLPNNTADPIDALSKLDLQVKQLSETLNNLNPIIEGARVPIAPSEIESITPEELLQAMCEILPAQVTNQLSPVTFEDLASVDFCKPAEPPAPQVTFEDFEKLCEQLAPPSEPSKKIEPSPSPDLDEKFGGIFSIPEDNPGDLNDRNQQLNDILGVLDKLDAFGDPTDILSEELTKSDIGLLLSDAADNFRNNDGLTQAQIDALRDSINNSNLDSINEPPPRPDSKVAIDCVKILQPIIEESQKKGSRFREVKTKIADLKQEVKILKVFKAFWDAVDYTLSDPKYKTLISLIKQKSDKEIQKKNTSSVALEQTLVNEIKDLDKKIKDFFKNDKSIGLGFSFLLFSVEDELNNVVKKLSIEIDIKFDKLMIPEFIYDKSKISQSSDRRLQKIQKKLTDAVKKIDLSVPEGVESIKKIQKQNDVEYEKEIDDTIDKLKSVASTWVKQVFVGGSKNQDAINAKVKEVRKNFDDNQKPKIDEYDNLVKEDAEIQDYFDNLNTTIKDNLRAQGCELPDLQPPELDAGYDVNFKGIPFDANKSPTIFDLRWWVSFCKLATLINLAPVHWPVGLILPTIPKPLFIPCPIIWAPIAVFNTPIALIVILIGQCGVLPSPFVFVLNTAPFPLGPLNARSGWFPVAIRPMVKIKDNITSEKLPGTPEINLPLANPEDIKKQIEVLKKRIEENNKKIAENNAEIERLKAENEKLLNDITNLQARVNDELERQKRRLQDLQKAAEENAEDNAELAKKIEDANKSIQEANKASEDAKKQVEKNKKEAEAAKNAAQNSVNAANEAKKKAESATNKKNEVLKKIENVESQYEAVKDNPLLALPLLAQIASLKSDLESIQQDVIQADQEAGKAIDEAEIAREKVINTNNEIKKSEEKIREAQEKAQKAKEKIDALTKQQAELAKRRGELNTKISENGGQTDSESAIESTRNRINKNIEKIQELINNNLKLYQTNVELQAKIAQLTLVIGFSANQKAKIEIDPAITALLPLYIDDLPTWERISLINIPFLAFLWQWCAAGKNGGGFLRDPI
jgi:methyl-accepting chemotaxis protein